MCMMKFEVVIAIHVDFEELTAMASEQLGLGPELQSMTPATSSLGLVTNPIPQQPCNPPPRDDWDCLFQPIFDEYFNTPTITVSSVPVANAPRAVDLADSPVSLSIDQDAPSTSISSTQDQEHSPIISQNEFGGVLKNKARLVAQGFRQEEGINFKESFGCKNRCHLYLCSKCSQQEYDDFQMDVKMAFLNGKLKEEEQVENGIVELYFLQTEYQLADIFIKPLPREIQLLDRKAWYAKHVSGNAKTSDRGARRVMVEIVDRLTKSAHFLPLKENDKMEETDGFVHKGNCLEEWGASVNYFKPMVDSRQGFGSHPMKF
ncbi:retrovirus-related pol polyprotein from transposon TNT 1-94 [Tanacetum coccineum]